MQSWHKKTYRERHPGICEGFANNVDCGTHFFADIFTKQLCRFSTTPNDVMEYGYRSFTRMTCEVAQKVVTLVAMGMT